MIDLRSDTVTKPTDAMRRAMMEAEVGDDVYRDDPTTLRLEAEAARLTGKEDALFVPSGTMGNQLAVMTHTSRGDEVILDQHCHIVEHEVGAAAVLSGVNLRTLPSVRGAMDPAAVAAAVRDTEDIHVPRSRLLCLENAHGGGQVLPLSYMREMRAVANAHGLAVHLDGARLFNAAAVLGCEASEIVSHVDSVMFCLSKGLCAPVGSLLCGDRAFIARARKYRKLLGGGMRQTGILAAAGLLSLGEMRARLPEDHRNARLLADRLSALPGFAVEPPQINMVFFRLPARLSAEAFHAGLLRQGVITNPAMGGEVRLLTHHGVTEADVSAVADLIAAM